MTRISARAYCHATEDCNKVARAVSVVMPGPISTETMRGYHGNEIKLLSSEVEGCQAYDLFLKILKNLDYIELSIFKNSLNIFKNKIYMRFNKQKAFMGVLRFDTGDDVVIVEVRVPKNYFNAFIDLLNREYERARNIETKEQRH